MDPEEPTVDDEVVFLHFESVADAERAIATIDSLDAEGFLQFTDAAIIRRSDDGGFSVTPVERTGPGRKVTLGAVLGAVAGGLVGLPVLGAAAGAGAAAKKSLGSDHLDELIDTVGRDMASGTAVLALTVTALSDPESVTDRLQIHREKLLRAEIPPALRAQLDGESGAD